MTWLEEAVASIRDNVDIAAKILERQGMSIDLYWLGTAAGELYFTYRIAAQLADVLENESNLGPVGQFVLRLVGNDILEELDGCWREIMALLRAENEGNFIRRWWLIRLRAISMACQDLISESWAERAVWEIEKKGGKQ